jgi:hypothetical protein
VHIVSLPLCRLILQQHSVRQLVICYCDGCRCLLWHVLMLCLSMKFSSWYFVILRTFVVDNRNIKYSGCALYACIKKIYWQSAKLYRPDVQQPAAQITSMKKRSCPTATRVVSARSASTAGSGYAETSTMAL